MKHVGKILIGLLLLLCLVVFVTKSYFLNYYRIPQNGMYPTIKANDLVFARLRPYKNVAAVKRGDVVLYQQKQDGESFLYVWRVIGLPGDQIETSGDGVVVNGQLLKREKVRQEDKVTIYREKNGETVYEIAIDYERAGDPPRSRLTVPENQLFVMGDNRLDAHDSRYVGPIPFDTVIGKKL